MMNRKDPVSVNGPDLGLRFSHSGKYALCQREHKLFNRNLFAQRHAKQT